MGVAGWSAWAVEGRTVLQPEVIGRLGRPQPHGIDRVVLIAGHWSVIGHGEHHLATGTRMGHSQQDLPPTRTGATGRGVQVAQWQPGPQCPIAPGASPLRTRPTRPSLLHAWGPSALTRGQTGHPHQQHCCGPSLPSSESLSTWASPAHHGTNIYALPQTSSDMGSELPGHSLHLASQTRCKSALRCHGQDAWCWPQPTKPPGTQYTHQPWAAAPMMGTLLRHMVGMRSKSGPSHTCVSSHRTPSAVCSTRP